MKTVTQLGTPSAGAFNCKWFNFGRVSIQKEDGLFDAICCQDADHVLTKGRTRLLKTSSIYPMGNKVVSNGHLKYLIENVSKDKHFLTNSDIEPRDRQNVKSAEKISSNRTRDCLKQYVPGSEATVLYLKMINYATSPFIDPKMNVSERIRKVWYSVFLCRIWRSWILEMVEIQKKKVKLKNLQIKLRSFVLHKKPLKNKVKRSANYMNQKKLKKYFLRNRSSGKSQVKYQSEQLNKICDKLKRNKCDRSRDNNIKKNCDKKTIKRKDNVSNYNLKDCFISSNLYNCIEINAHSLIKFILKLRSDNNSTMFFPTLLGSQPCEKSFRQLRSMTTTQSTIINFSILDMLHRMNKIELQNEMMSKCSFLKFPRHDRKTAAEQPELINLPNDAEIISLIEEAKEDATNDARDVGMLVSNTNFSCQVDPISDCNNDVDLHYQDEEFLFESERFNDELDDAENLTPDLQDDLNKLNSVTGSLQMRDYSECQVKLSETSPYTVVSNSSGKDVVVRKSSICWLLSKDKHSLSSDRLLRVRDTEMDKSKKM